MLAEETNPNDAEIGRARYALLRRLIDVVAMPASRLPPQDRSMAGDVLLEILFEASDRERAFCAQRLAPTLEAPRRVLRYLAQCALEVAEPLLLENESFDDSDLCFIIEQTGVDHLRTIARRKTLGAALCDAIARTSDTEAIQIMLKNKRAFVSETAMDLIVGLSRDHRELTELMINREELRPNQALTLFWWSGPDVRRSILMRYSADRSELIDICADIFSMAANEGWSDPVVRKTLQLIERRQRNRAAIEKSPYENLEEAVALSGEAGMNRELAEEIGYLSGLKPLTLAKILTDPGGEGLAVLCKATGLKRTHLTTLWQSLKRPIKTPEGGMHPLYDHVLETFEVLSSAKAQTILRYWTWSLSSAYSPAAASQEDEELDSELGFSSSRRTAQLVFGD